MVSKESILRVVDNSGIIYVKCLNPPIDSKSYTFYLGARLTVIPKVIDYSKKLRKKKYYAVVLCLKKITRRKSGIWVRSKTNRVVILNEQLKFLGTRIYGPMCLEVRTKKNLIDYRKVISYSNAVI